ncbi:hypothetical protein [Streptococcus cuniculi]|uniref:Lipoprotein n=1 Tax=Streptococcus cuniculi TaxID=1432788 RepID=A0A4Y9JB66_9STRE|nr:hypothetical protein [Streptococcus cuniculi]MBF0777885.1 hypothetical protein [Streptococcus cuniculi]TFU98182.1 hypothetical protein E4T82_04000 [Streptococcus cuniculi]
MKTRYVLLLCLSFLLVACSHKEVEIKPDEKKIVVEKEQSSLSENQSSSDLVAETFIKTYIEQSFEKENLDQKESDLRRLAGDSSLDTALSDLSALKSELAEYRKTKTIRTSASFILVERELVALEVYKNGEKYFVSVKFKETSPAYSGEIERRMQYKFKVHDSKIFQFEEIL